MIPRHSKGLFLCRPHDKRLSNTLSLRTGDRRHRCGDPYSPRTTPLSHGETDPHDASLLGMTFYEDHPVMCRGGVLLPTSGQPISANCRSRKSVGTSSKPPRFIRRRRRFGDYIARRQPHKSSAPYLMCGALLFEEDHRTFRLKLILFFCMCTSSVTRSARM